MKEIVVVKNDINKFNFFFIHIDFKIEIDKKAFPKIIQLNPKIVPNP